MTKDEDKFWEAEIERAMDRAAFEVLMARHRAICDRLLRHLNEYCEAIKAALNDQTK
jgi:hypothetical protein